MKSPDEKDYLNGKIKRLKEKAIARKNSPKRILASLIRKTKEEDDARDELIEKLENLEKKYQQISREDAILLQQVGEEKTESSSSLVERIYQNLLKTAVFCLDYDGCSDIERILANKKEDMSRRKYDLGGVMDGVKTVLSRTDIDTLKNKHYDTIITYALFDNPNINIADRETQKKAQVLGLWMRENIPALEEIKKKIDSMEPEKEKLTIITGSNRQSNALDKSMTSGKRNAYERKCKKEKEQGTTNKLGGNYIPKLCWETLDGIAKVIEKNGITAKFDRSLLSNFRDTNKGFEKDKCLVDDMKAVMLIKQMHKVAANENKSVDDKPIEFNFLDDRQDILEGLNVVFTKHPEYIPRGMNLKLQAAATDEDMTENSKFETVELSGTGPILNPQQVETIYSEYVNKLENIRKECNKPFEKKDSEDNVVARYYGREIGLGVVPLFSHISDDILSANGKGTADVRKEFEQAISLGYTKAIMNLISCHSKEANTFLGQLHRALSTNTKEERNKDIAHVVAHCQRGFTIPHCTCTEVSAKPTVAQMTLEQLLDHGKKSIKEAEEKAKKCQCPKEERGAGNCTPRI